MSEWEITFRGRRSVVGTEVGVFRHRYGFDEIADELELDEDIEVTDEHARQFAERLRDNGTVVDNMSWDYQGADDIEDEEIEPATIRNLTPPPRRVTTPPRPTPTPAPPARPQQGDGVWHSRPDPGAPVFLHPHGCPCGPCETNRQYATMALPAPEATAVSYRTFATNAARRQDEEFASEEQERRR